MTRSASKRRHGWPVHARRKKVWVRFDRKKASVRVDCKASVRLGRKKASALLGHSRRKVRGKRGRCTVLNKIPTEVRRIIFKHCAMPDQKVSHTTMFWRERLRADGKPVATELFRVSRVIHDEVADVFYGAQPFSLVLSNSQRGHATMTFCYGSKGLSLTATQGIVEMAPKYFRRIRQMIFNVVFKVAFYDAARLYGGTNFTLAQLAAQERFERDRLRNLIAEVCRRAHHPLQVATINIQIDGERIPFARPGVGRLERMLDDEARAHCTELLETFAQELYARVVAVDCWRRPRQAVQEIKPKYRLGTLPDGEEVWFDPELEPGQVDLERKSMEAKMRDTEEQIRRHSRPGT
jgi:hypothetical protein